MSQAVNLTQDSNGTTCRDETAIFTCTVTTQRVRWTAGPYNPVSITGAVSQVGDTVERADDAIIVTVVSLSPMFTTTLTASGSLTEDFVVECEALAGDGNTIDRAQLMYLAGGKL